MGSTPLDCFQMNKNNPFVNIISGLLELIEASKAGNRAVSLPVTTSAKKQTPRYSVEAEIPKGQSYFSYLSQLFKKHKTELPHQSQSQRPSYRLSEDIYLLLELSNHATLSIKVFEQIHNKKEIHRTVESMRARFSQYIRWLEEKDIKRIIQWIKDQGLVGYMYFQDGGDGHKKFVEVRHEDQRQIQKKRNKKDKPVEKQLPGLTPEMQNLERQLRNYATVQKAPTAYLLQKLDQLSGDLNDLEQYIETKNDGMLWSAEEDQSLKDGGFSHLVKYKGKEKVEKRKKYLGL